MERDCIISHGAASFLKERLIMVSDLYEVHICSKCGLIAVADPEHKRYFCRVCTDKSSALPTVFTSEGISHVPEIFRVQVPYAAKLLFQELMSMLILPKI